MKKNNITFTYTWKTQKQFYPFTIIRNFSVAELTTMINDVAQNIENLLPQFESFVSKFQNHLHEADINIINDAQGHDISVKNNLPEAEEKKIVKKYLVLEGLVEARILDIEQLVEKGSKLEIEMKKVNPEFKSKILEKANAFERIRENYRG